MRKIILWATCLVFGTILLFTMPGSISAEEKEISIEDRFKEIDFDKYFARFSGVFVLHDLKSKTTLRSDKKRAAERLSPCSTFKIPNSLIGLHFGVVKDKDTMFTWDGTKYRIRTWERDHTLSSAIKNSVVWYYQKIAHGVGEKNMKKYLRKLKYGNKDISGGLTTFWLDGSLKISADEQIKFLSKLYHNKLPFKKEHITLVKEILRVASGKDYVYSGKTGSACEEGMCHLGWYVGYIKNGPQEYVYALNIKGTKHARGKLARTMTEKLLANLGLLRYEKARTFTYSVDY